MADLGSLPDAAYDMAVAYLSIIDVLDYERAIAEVARVLKPWPVLVLDRAPRLRRAGGQMGAAGGGHHPDHGPRQALQEGGQLLSSTRGAVPDVADRPNRDNQLSPPAVGLRSYCASGRIHIPDIHEPVPADEVLEQRDYLREHKRLPFFMIIECVKPA